MTKHTGRVRLTLLTSVALLMMSWSGWTQSEIAPTNDLPNPNWKTTVAPWGKLPAGRKWGAVNSIGIDRDGKSIWVADRCGPKEGSSFGNDVCAGSNLPTVLKFDADGNLLKSFGEGLMIQAHSLFVDPDGNVWVADARSATPKELEQYPDAKGKGRRVFKFSPDGKLLMTLGKGGVSGDPPDAFDEPDAVITGANGDIFVADGNHSGQGGNPTPGTAGRIVKFTKDGKFIKSWGKLGSGPGEFRTPHSLAIDARGRLFVADRGNNRIQIFDQDGKYIDQWAQFGRPSGLFIDKNDMLYVADSEDWGVSTRAGWERGIRIGSARDGKIMYRIPDPVTGKTNGTSAAEGVAVDAAGNVFGGEVGPRQIAKHVYVK